jgi:hypothetical protein
MTLPIGVYACSAEAGVASALAAFVSISPLQADNATASPIEPRIDQRFVIDFMT